MAANKTPWPILGLVFIGQLMITFLGIILLAILIDELAESGQIVPGFMQAYLAYPEA